MEDEKLTLSTNEEIDEAIVRKNGAPMGKDFFIIVFIVLAFVISGVFIVSKVDLKTPMQQAELDAIAEAETKKIHRDTFPIQFTKDKDFYSNGALFNDGIIYVVLDEMFIYDESAVGEEIDHTNKTTTYTQNEITGNNGMKYLLPTGNNYYKCLTDNKLLLLEYKSDELKSKYKVLVNEDFYSYYQLALTYDNFITLATDTANISVNQDVSGGNKEVTMSHEELMYLSKNVKEDKKVIYLLDRDYVIENLITIKCENKTAAEWHVVYERPTDTIFWYKSYNGKNCESYIFMRGNNEELNNKIYELFSTIIEPTS